MALAPPSPGSLVLLGQGAEARLFARAFLGAPCVLKERLAERYRQPAL
jgi:tRNA A-37 threonylcarbamoyl transferase component Bud32